MMPSTMPSTMPYGTVRQYGTGSVGNGTIPGAPVVPSSYYTNETYEPSQMYQPTAGVNKIFSQSSSVIGQNDSCAHYSCGWYSIIQMRVLANIAAGWTSSQFKDFCGSTKGGKKLAF